MTNVFFQASDASHLNHSWKHPRRVELQRRL